MTSRQKHKGKKRPRSWHHRYNTPDRAFAAADRRLERALKRAGQGSGQPGENGGERVGLAGRGAAKIAPVAPAISGEQHD